MPPVLSAQPDTNGGTSASGGLVDNDQTVQTGGDQTLDQTSWTALTGLDVTIDAAAGDVVDLHLSGYPNSFSGGNAAAFDIATIAANAIVNRVSGGTGNSDFGCLEALRNTADGTVIARRYTVQAGDVVAGTVHFRGYYRVNNGSATFSTGANFRSAIQATNLGAVS